MKSIKESLLEIQDITPYLKGEKVDEGLKEIFNSVKAKFKQVFLYLKGVVARFGTYFLGVDKDGKVLGAISPLTAGAAYVDGSINKKTTLVVMDKEGAKITGCKTKFKDALKLRGTGNSIKYWEEINESEENAELATVLEEYINNFNAVNEVKLKALDPEAEYNRITDSDELKEEIKIHIQNSASLGRLMIWGAPGIGKTAILDNALNELEGDFKDYRLIYKTLSNETPDNFTLPKYVEIDGQEFATDVPKTWLPVYKPTGNPEEDRRLDELCGKGLLFVDELSRATPQVLNVVLPLVNEGVFNGYKLGSNWAIIVASNRPEDETSGQTNIGNALSNRFTHVFFEPTVESWRKWADNQGFISPLLLQWLSMPASENMSGRKFYYCDPNEEPDALQETCLMCTPRSWTNAMRKLAVYSHTGKLEGFTIFDIPDRIIKRVLNGCVPKTAVDSFMSFLSVISKIGNFDSAVYEVWKNGGKGLKIDKKDLNKVTLPLAQLIVSAHSDSLPTDKEWESLCDFLVAQNSDQLASYTLDVFGNVFMSDVDKSLWSQILTMSLRIKKAGGDESKLKAFRMIAKNFCTRWGLSEIEDIPDYVPGLQKVIKKYGESFQSAVVGDHDAALG